MKKELCQCFYLWLCERTNERMNGQNEWSNGAMSRSILYSLIDHFFSLLFPAEASLKPRGIFYWGMKTRVTINSNVNMVGRGVVRRRIDLIEIGSSLRISWN